MSKRNPLMAAAIVLLGLTAWAALPPLSEQDRQEQASDILDGTVLNIKRTEVDNDIEYRLNFRVENKVKGTLRSGILLPVILRQTGKRPAGWAGPQGQNEIPAEDQKVRFFLLEQQGVYRALEPNGWEPR